MAWVKTELDNSWFQFDVIKYYFSSFKFQLESSSSVYIDVLIPLPNEQGKSANIFGKVIIFRLTNWIFLTLIWISQTIASFASLIVS